MLSTRIAGRAESMPPFIVMDVLEAAQAMEKAGADIVHLEVGEPDFPTPEPVKEAALRALRDNDTHYTHSLGKMTLREEIARWYWERYQVSVSPDQILVTSGTSPALLLIFSVLLEPNDQVILPNPYYACYPNFIRYSDGEPDLVRVDETNGFKYQGDLLADRIGKRTRAVMINSPANPTGAVLTGAEMKRLAELPAWLVADEIYNGLIYAGEEHSILEFTDRAFVANGFSKLFAMTGWRLGYVIAPAAYVRSMQKLQQNLFICASSFAQEGGIAALRECRLDIQQMVETYGQRRQYLLKRLRSMGIAPQVDPSGAFYVLANIHEYSLDSYSLAFDILKRAQVAVTPGIDFGSACEGYIRISYANSLERIQEGMDRLESYLAALKQS